MSDTRIYIVAATAQRAQHTARAFKLKRTQYVYVANADQLAGRSDIAVWVTPQWYERPDAGHLGAAIEWAKNRGARVRDLTRYSDSSTVVTRTRGTKPPRIYGSKATH